VDKDNPIKVLWDLLRSQGLDLDEDAFGEMAMFVEEEVEGKDT